MSRDQRSSLLGGHNGFQQIPEPRNGNTPPPGDATIDIPLAPVTTKTGSRKSHESPPVLSEKPKLFGIGGGRKRKEREEQKRKKKDDGLRTMGRIYKRILNFSIITRYFLYILPVGAVISIPIIVGATALPEQKLGEVRIVWIWSWVLLVWVSLWVSKVFAKLLPYIFEFLCGIVSSGTRKYALILKALEIPLSLTGWALAALATFVPIMTQNPDQRKLPDGNALHPWQQIVQRILAAILVSTIIFLATKLLVQLISVNYHRMQYDLRIKESKHNVRVLGILYDASVALFPAYCPEFSEEDYVIQDQPELGSRTETGHIKSGAATPMRILANVNRVGDKITAAFGHIAQEVTGKEVFNPTSSHSVVVEALEKKRSSEALAKRLWMSLVVEGKDALYQEDVIEVLCERSQSEAIEVFQALDRDNNGDVSLDEMILAVCEIGRERKAIASSLHDVDQAIHVLDSLLCTIMFVACIFVFIAFLNESFVTTLATAGTALLSLSFIFSGTAAEVLGSCIFLFVKHPFDVGDRVDISGEHLVVERISLLYSVFKNIKNHRTTQAPNVVLNSLWIDNVTRSKAMREQLQLFINFDSTLEDIQLLRKEMQNFVLDKENNRDFEPEIDVEVTGVAEMNKMELTVEIRHKSNWSNESVRASRRSKFMCALVLALRKVPIYGPAGSAAPLGSADQPSYSVSVSDADAAAAREAFNQSKEEKRMKPIKPATTKTLPSQDYGTSTGTSASPFASENNMRNRSTSIGPARETNALNVLNARSPGADPAHDWQNNPATRHVHTGITSVIPEEGVRNEDLNEVYGLLHRKSTRGKRRESYALSPRDDHNETQPAAQPSYPSPAPRIHTPTTPYTTYDYAGTPPRPGTSTTTATNNRSPPRPQPPQMSATQPHPGEDVTRAYAPYAAISSSGSPAPRYEYPPPPRQSSSGMGSMPLSPPPDTPLSGQHTSYASSTGSTTAAFPVPPSSLPSRSVPSTPGQPPAAYTGAGDVPPVPSVGQSHGLGLGRLARQNSFAVELEGKGRGGGRR